jgi:hypothetical protein
MTNLFQDILQAIDNVPVHIGAVELKQLLYNEIIPLWNSFTEECPLAIEDIVMRSKEWVVIQPLNPDRDVISRPFFKSGRGGAVVFKAGRCIVLFHIPNNIYSQYLNHAERKQKERVNKHSEEPEEVSEKVNKHATMTDY